MTSLLFGCLLLKSQDLERARQIARGYARRMYPLKHLGRNFNALFISIKNGARVY